MFIIKSILELMGRNNHFVDEVKRKHNYVFVPHIVKRKEIEKKHRKFRRWCKIHNIPFNDYSNLRYDKKSRKWVRVDG